MNNSNNKKNLIKRIVALLGAIILILMFVATFVVAVWNFEGSDRVFKALIGCDIFVPIILWAYIMIYRWAASKDKGINKKVDELLEDNESLSQTIKSQATNSENE